MYTPTLDPENLISFEIGGKTTLFDGALRVAADIYAMVYENKQESILVNFGDLFCPYVLGDFDGNGVFDDFDGDGSPLNDIANAGVGVPGSFFVLSQVDPTTGNMTVTQDQLDACQEPTFNTQEFNIDFVELVNLNVSGAVTAGLEMEWFWQLSNNLRFDGFFTINPINEVGNVDTSNFELPPEVLGDVIACVDRVGGCPDVRSLEGNRLPFSPVVSGAVNLGYDFFLADSVLSAEASVNFSSSYFLSIWNVDCYQSLAPGQPTVWRQRRPTEGLRDRGSQPTLHVCLRSVVC